MFRKMKKQSGELKNRTVYLELFSDRKVAYRVTAGITVRYGERVDTYGIEAIDVKTGEFADITDFSPDINDAVAFAELLSSQKARPRQLYGKALGFLGVSI